MIQDSGIGAFDLATVRTELADTSRGFMDRIPVGPVYFSLRVVSPYRCRWGEVMAAFTLAISWSNMAITRATWVIRTGFLTDYISGVLIEYGRIVTFSRSTRIGLTRQLRSTSPVFQQ